MKNHGPIFLTGQNVLGSGESLSLSPFALFLESKKVLQLQPSGNPREIEVCIDREYRFRGSFFPKPRRNAVLVRIEPKVVQPSNYSRRITLEYRKVISIGADPGLGGLHINVPQVWPTRQWWIDPLVRTSERIILVNSNKFSFIQGELYSLRRAVIKNLSVVDVAGQDWNEETRKTFTRMLKALMFALAKLQFPAASGLRNWKVRPGRYLGSPSDKIELMSGYRVAVVIENSATYLSEKIFDAFFAGCIPVYVGPPLASYEIPEYLVVQVGASVREVARGILVAQGLDYDLWKVRVNAFLTSDSTVEAWSETKVYQRLLDIIQE